MKERCDPDQLRQKLGVNQDEMNSLFTTLPVGGYIGTDVAKGICERLGINPKLLEDYALSRILLDYGFINRDDCDWMEDN